jgi:hypothetical protein
MYLKKSTMNNKNIYYYIIIAIVGVSFFAFYFYNTQINKPRFGLEVVLVVPLTPPRYKMAIVTTAVIFILLTTIIPLVHKRIHTCILDNCEYAD